jgi:hypothetical protein
MSLPVGTHPGAATVSAGRIAGKQEAAVGVGPSARALRATSKGRTTSAWYAGQAWAGIRAREWATQSIAAGSAFPCHDTVARWNPPSPTVAGAAPAWSRT